MSLYEVYIVKVSKSVVYIGMGLNKRHLHATSGVSHVYALNKIHFKDPTAVSVFIISNNLSQERALELELELIKHYRPVFNKRDNEKYNNKYVPIQYIDEVTKKNREN